MNRVSTALLALPLVLPAVAAAQQPSDSQFDYTYVELAYDEFDIEISNVELDGDGFTLSGAFELNDDWHVYGSFSNADLEFAVPADLDTWAIGAGYSHPLNQDTDLYGRVLYIDADADVGGGGGVDDDGLGLQLRVRSRLTDNGDLEVEGGIQHIDVFESDTSLQAGARYHFNENLSAGIGITFASDNDSVGINARFQF